MLDLFNHFYKQHKHKQAAGQTVGGQTTLSGIQVFQQDVQEQFMSPYQTQVIDATLAEFDRNKAIQEQSIRDQQAALGAFGAGRAGVQLSPSLAQGQQENEHYYKHN